MFKDLFGDIRYKVGLHIHTTASDGKKNKQECALIYKNAGYDAIAVTDHWVYGEDTEIAGLKVFSGCEYNMGGRDTSVDVMHIVGLGMKYDPELNNSMTRQQIIDGIRNAGGLAMLAHPAWSLNTTDEVMALSGFEALEIYNAVSEAGQSFRAYSGLFVDQLANRGTAYPLTATDDVHYYDGSDETKAYIMVKCKELTADSVLDAVRNGEFYATQGPELHVKVENGKVHVICSPCSVLRIVTNSAWSANRVVRGENITGHTYQLGDWEKWVRVEVVDDEGKTAWSNLSFVK